MPLLLILYVYFFVGLECWPGLTRNAFKNWGPMIRLALPGMVMVMAEFLAFEILTLSSSWISATHLGANTILQTLSVITFQLPFPLSIAASTRVANLIGATLPEAAIVTTRVTFIIGAIIGVFNMVLLLSLRDYVPYLFTNDKDVALLASQVLPVNAAFQLVDAIAAQCNGLLRGLGKQEFGGYLNLFAYYAVSIVYLSSRSPSDRPCRLLFLYHSALALACIGVYMDCGLDQLLVWPSSLSAKAITSGVHHSRKQAKRQRCVMLLGRLQTRTVYILTADDTACLPWSISSSVDGVATSSWICFHIFVPFTGFHGCSISSFNIIFVDLGLDCTLWSTSVNNATSFPLLL